MIPANFWTAGCIHRCQHLRIDSVPRPGSMGEKSGLDSFVLFAVLTNSSNVTYTSSQNCSAFLSVESFALLDTFINACTTSSSSSTPNETKQERALTASLFVLQAFFFLGGSQGLTPYCRFVSLMPPLNTSLLESQQVSLDLIRSSSRSCPCFQRHHHRLKGRDLYRPQ